MSALLEAFYRGQTEQVEQLLAGDPELDVFEAAALGKTDRLREVLDEDASRANAFGDDGFHPLGLACFFGHVDAARLLLEHGADPNLRQGRGFRAIDAARLNGDERVEQLLVQYGADR